MLLLGKTLINEDNILCVSPHYTNPEAVVLTTKGLEKVYIDCTEDEFLTAIEDQLGLGSMPRSELSFTNTEFEEMYAAGRDGYRFVAKDKTGQVYAYDSPIQKSSASWDYVTISACIAKAPRRMRCEYAALSFEDKCPVDILAIDGLEVTG